MTPLPTLCLLFAAGGALLAQASKPLPSVRELTEKFDAAQARATTLQAPFTLTIKRAMLKTPTVTRGNLYLKGSDFVHFAFSPPEDLILHLSPKSLISYSPGTGQGEMLKIGFIRNSDRRFLGLGQKISLLADYFKVTVSEGQPSNTYLATLTPRSLSMRKRFNSLCIWMDKDSYLPRQVHWIERSGDEWQLELGALKVNEAIPPAVTNFKVPTNAALRSEFSFFATKKSK